jgi:hypothetical protein
LLDTESGTAEDAENTEEQETSLEDRKRPEDRTVPKRHAMEEEPTASNTELVVTATETSSPEETREGDTLTTVRAGENVTTREEK